jgi:hypothetical protein
MKFEGEIIIRPDGDRGAISEVAQKEGWECCETIGNSGSLVRWTKEFRGKGSECVGDVARMAKALEQLGYKVLRSQARFVVWDSMQESYEIWRNRYWAYGSGPGTLAGYDDL